MMCHILYNSFYLYTSKLGIVKNLHYSMPNKCYWSVYCDILIKFKSEIDP